MASTTLLPLTTTSEPAVVSKEITEAPTQASSCVQVVWIGSNSPVTTVDLKDVCPKLDKSKGVCPLMLVQIIARVLNTACNQIHLASRPGGPDLNTPLTQPNVKRPLDCSLVLVDSRRFYVTLRNPCDVAIDRLIRDGQLYSCLTFGALPQNVRNDKRVAAVAVDIEPKLMGRLDTLKANKDFVLGAIKSKPFMLAYVDERLRADKDVVRTAVLKDGEVLRYATTDLQQDEELVLAALPTCLAALSLVPMTVDYMSTAAFWHKAYDANARVYKYLRSLPKPCRGTHEDVRTLLLQFRMEQTGH